MTPAELDFIKDAFSQIIDDIAGNPDWHDAASAVSADLGALERELEGKVVSPDKSLEEEIEKYLHSLGLGHGGWVDGLADDDLRNLARHFAEWQKEELKDDLDFAKQLKLLREMQRRSKLDEFIEVRYHEGLSKVLFTTAIKSAFEMGMEQQKEQMLKDAVEAYIVKSYNPCTEKSERSLHGIELLYEDKNKPYLLAGDKVRIIVIKAEGGIKDD